MLFQCSFMLFVLMFRVLMCSLYVLLASGFQVACCIIESFPFKLPYVGWWIPASRHIIIIIHGSTLRSMFIGFGWSKSASLALKSCRRLPKARVWRTSSHSCRCWHEIHDMIWRSWNFLGKRTATKRSRLQDLRCSYSLADKLHILEHNFYMFPLPKARKWQPSILDVSLPYGWNLDMPPMNRKSSYIYIARVCSIDMHWQYLSNITNIAKIGNIRNI